MGVGYTHWKMLRFDDDGVKKDDKSILNEWEVKQERFFKADDNMLTIFFLDSPIPKSQKKNFKWARISKPPPLSHVPKILFINVEGDGNYSFGPGSTILSKG